MASSITITQTTNDAVTKLLLIRSLAFVFVSLVVAGLASCVSAATLVQESPAAQAAAAAGGQGSLSAGSQAAPVDEAAEEAAVKEKIAQRRQSLFDALLDELDNMVPGEFEEDSPQKAELARAVNAFLDRDVPTIRAIFEEQAAFDSDFPPMNLMLASMSYRVRNPQQGRKLLEKAAVKSPRYPGTYAAFARLALNEGRITDAMALLEKCARMVRENDVSDKVKTHFGKQYIAGMLQVAIAQERYQDARDLLERQMKQSPDSPKSHLIGAEIEFKTNNLDKSQSYLEKLKELVPKSKPYESIFAAWFRQAGKTKQAAEWTQVAADKHPKDATVQLDYASWLLSAGKLVEADAAIKNVETLSSESLTTRFLKGRLAFANDDMEQAEQYIGDVVAATKGRNIEAMNLFTLVLAESDDDEKTLAARKMAQQTLGRAPNSSVAKAAMAYVLMKRGDLDRAQKLIVPVARQPRVSSEVAYFFGYLLKERGNKDAARQAFQSALKSDGLFLYRKKCEALLNQLGGPIEQMPAPTDDVKQGVETDALPTAP